MMDNNNNSLVDEYLAGAVNKIVVHGCSAIKFISNKVHKGAFKAAAKVYVEPEGLEWKKLPPGELLKNQCADFLAHPKQRVFVLLGDPGVGKTSFIHRIFEHYLNEFEEGKNRENQASLYLLPLPLLINLDDAFRNKKNIRSNFLIDDYLKEEVRLEPDQVTAIRAHQRLIVFCDGFDEISFDKNLYRHNCWGQEWPRMKCVISSRPEKFGTALSEDHLQQALIDAFSPLHVARGAPFPKSLRISQLSPFSPVQVTSFIEQWQEVSQSNVPQWTVARYEEALANIPGLQALTSNPVILSLVLHSLPAIIRDHEDNPDILKRQQLQRIDVYDKFVTVWFKEQIVRLEQKLERSSAGLLNKLYKLQGFNLVDALKNYTTQLAYWTVLNNHSGKLNLEIPDVITLQPYLLNNPTQGSQPVSEALNEAEKIALCRALRSGCLLNCDGKHFRFFHKSLVEYFAQAYIFKDVVGLLELAIIEEQNQNIIIREEQESVSAGADALNHQLVEVNLLRLMAERVKRERAGNTTFPFKQCLENIIQRSRNKHAIAWAAANAITILNYAQEPLNLLPLQGVHIPGADLSDAFLFRANLQGADVSGVCFRGACLAEANLEEAVVMGCEWGIPNAPLRFDGAVTALIFTPDDQWLIAGDDRGKIYFVHRQSFTIARPLKHYTARFSPGDDEVSSLAVNGDKTTSPSWLASGNKSLFNGKIYLWQLPKRTYKGTLSEKTMGSISALVFYANGVYLASASSDGVIRLWDPNKRKPLRKLADGYHSYVRYLSYSPQSGQLASGGAYTSKLHLWQPTDGSAQVLSRSTDRVTCIAYSPQGEQLASGSEDEMVHLWQLSDKSVQVLKGHTSTVTCIAYSPQGEQLASGSKDNTVRLWQLSDKSAQVLQGHTNDVTCIAYSPQGDQLASGSRDKTVRLWQMKSNTSEVVQEHSAGTSSAIAYSSQEERLTSGSWAKGCSWFMYDNASQDTSDNPREASPGSLLCIAYSLQDDQLASANINKMIYLWRISDNASLIPQEHPDQVLLGCFSGDLFRKCDTVLDKTPRVLQGHTAMVYSIAYSPKGDQLASGSEDKTVRLWQLSNNNARVLLGHTDVVWCVAYSPKGDQLASGSHDATVRLWDTQTGICVRVIEVEFVARSLLWQEAFLKIAGYYYTQIKEKIAQSLTYELTGNEPRLCEWLERKAPPFTTHPFAKINIARVKGLNASHFQFLKSQGAIGKPAQFLPVSLNLREAQEQDKNLKEIVALQKILQQPPVDPELRGKSVINHQDNDISHSQWQVYLLRISQPATHNTRHVFGLLEGLDPLGRHTLIRFHFVEDRALPGSGLIIVKSKFIEGELTQANARAAFMSLLESEDNPLLPRQLVCHCAGFLTSKNVSKLLTEIIHDHSRQSASNKQADSRIRYRFLGGDAQSNETHNCLSWLLYILRGLDLTLPRTAMDWLYSDPKSVLKVSGFFALPAELKLVDTTGWEAPRVCLKQNLN